jgi:lipopolysaccharide biosynthesis glycosyltransferase
MKESDAGANICLTTVTTDSFMPGTLVTLYSFLKHNRWFTGDIVVIHDELSEEYRTHLVNLDQRVKFLKVSEHLLLRVAEVAKVFPEFAQKEARFFSLETFRLRDYEKVLFCDSDLLFRRSIEDLFDLPQPLIVCGDGAYYHGRGRKWRGEQSANKNNALSLYDTFNSGVFLADKSLLTDENYAGLLNLVDSRTYQTPNMKLADQVMLNLYFAGQQYLVSGTYNYLLAHRAAIYEREGLGFMDARVLHFNVRYKPWLAHEVLREGTQDPAFIKACGLWFNDYVECLQSLFLQKQTRNLRQD